ncbi:queuine tRNA-ribosyltransferase family protein [Candidatus Dojkabacteria bacterium]|uniref:Queuine tRNA-ribosyltransferase n=2 Tax=Candidatus Dojkabacteria TaxID=74243 RepID=A0A136KL63_9BACT|nr:MAG: Queuine tRNA-ribosyltransferase [candidate division WS6 bacterium OLB21]MBW7953452.1 queuine tRNA-ribosyltransferase family protein [Candidatus Dojkabacteria bacterium]
MVRIEEVNNIRRATIDTPHGQINTPTFMPDATYGTVQEVSMQDLRDVGINEFVTTTLHIEQAIGSEYLKEYGSMHKFTGWDRPILTDSGGFQVYSLIHRNSSKHNQITEAGCSFIDYKTGNYNFLSPERSQYIQHLIGSDIRVVLDEPLIEDDSISKIRQSVERTTRWAQRSKKAFLEFNQLSEADFNNPEIKRPLLCAVIQGASSFEYRKISAEGLIDIGFDIYGFGGMPLRGKYSWKEDGKAGSFYHELTSYVAELIPKDKIRYALGVGNPDNLKFAIESGWDLFDTVLPTRNARHGYLYVNSGEGDASYDNFDVMHIKSERYKFDERQIDTKLVNPAYPKLSRAYLRHLIRMKSGSGTRVATMHNLQFYTQFLNGLLNRSPIPA